MVKKERNRVRCTFEIEKIQKLSTCAEHEAGKLFLDAHVYVHVKPTTREEVGERPTAELHS